MPVTVALPLGAVIVVARVDACGASKLVGNWVRRRVPSLLKYGTAGYEVGWPPADGSVGAAV